ncbi:MAG: glycosyltransferase family 1 protein [Bacteroidetes bacterium]|nr:glycosyltransferase family 1 protein [Bacteroidota bacterium]
MTSGNHLHIISFDIPFPANYGGVIDVFYKIRALHRAGVEIHLHCFEHRREHSGELNRYCAEVLYYPRNAGLMANIGIRPYIVASRMSQELVNNLLKDDYPILFEGLHTCGIMSDSRLKGRFMIYRESNIEHHYYYHLFKAEKHPGKKLYFLAESVKLKFFQKILRHASVMLAVSGDDTKYLASAFPAQKVVYLPSFHRDDEVHILPGKGSYALYQGKLSVPENIVAVEYLINRVWEDSFPELLVAGLDPPGRLTRLAAQHPNIRIIANPTDDEMFRLIREAQVNLMVTFQPTGLKLKLLNALFNGRFCLVNPDMVAGTSLDELCHIAGTSRELKDKLLHLFSLDFTPGLIAHRQSILQKHHSNQNNCNLFLEILNLR